MTKPIIIDDKAAKCRAALQFYALTPCKKYPLPTRIRKSDGKLVVRERRHQDWADILGQSRSYLTKLLNNTQGFVLANPRPFAEIVAAKLTEISGQTVRPEDVWDLDEEPTR